MGSLACGSLIVSKKHSSIYSHGLLGLFLALLAGTACAQTPFTGGVEASSTDGPIKVRNNVAQPAEPIVTQRYFKIKKGQFPQFLKLSQEGVWPYFAKIGSRVIGMWMVTHPEVTGTSASPDYDEVILMTQYASVEHWQATRDMASLGGNGPDWEKCMDAIQQRRELTIETSLQFLQGSTWHNPPYYMPGVN